MRTVGAIFTAGVLLTSCVSSKKYKASQASVAKLQTDSATLAQQVSTLHQDVTSWEQKNAELQKNIAAAGTTNAGLQKNVAYYTDYAGKQQSTTTALNDELKTTLAPAGFTDQDIITTEGKIYVNISEKSLFKNNSAVLTTKGKELVKSLGEFVKSKESVDVAIADLELANDGGTTTTSEMSSTSGTGAAGNRNASASTNNTASNNNADYTNTSGVKKAKRSVAVHHAKKPAASGESKSVTYASNRSNKYSAARTSRTAARAIAWKRQNVVADAMLKSGIPKVKLVSQLPGTGTPSANAQKGVQVILVNDMDNFYKHMSEAPATQPVSKNP